MTAVEASAYGNWRRNLGLTWIGVFVGLLGANFVFPFIPFYLEDLGVESKGEVALLTGVAASLTGFSLALTAPIWGVLADRVGRKPMLIRALLGAGVTMGLMGAVTSVTQFMGLRFVLGAFAGTMGAAAALVATTTPRERLGYALGTLQTAQYSANMLGPLIGGVAAALFGIREAFFFCGVLYMGAASLCLLIREPRAVAPAATKSRQASPGIIAALRLVLHEKQILVALGLVFTLWLSTNVIRPVLPLSVDSYATHAFGADSDADRVVVSLPGLTVRLKEEAATGVAFGVTGLTSTLAALSVASIGTRYGYRRTVIGAAVLTGFFFLPVAFAPGFASFVVALAALGLFQGAMLPGTNALIAAATPEGLHGSAFGLAASVQSISLMVGPLAGGAVAGAFSIQAAYVSIGAILAVVALLCYPALHEPAVLAQGQARDARASAAR